MSTARHLPATWIVTDGKAGDEAPCLGLTEALGLDAQRRRIAPRAPWVWAMPWGPADPRDLVPGSGGGIVPPWPGLAIGSGRRATAYIRHIRRASGGRTFTVILRDPRTGAGAADLIWVPEHDPLRGTNVLVTATSPHRISPERLAEARRAPPAPLAALSSPRAAVLLGGDSRHHRFTSDDIRRLLISLEALADGGVALMVTASRRTPPALRDAVFAAAARSGGFAWDGAGDNPYIPMLALADIIVATADSTNMIGEAAATGTGIHVFEPSGGHPKITAFLDGLARRGVTQPITGRPITGMCEPFSYSPLDSTPAIAEAMRKALAARGVIL